MTYQYEGLFYYKKNGSAFVRIMGFDDRNLDMPEDVFIPPISTGDALEGDRVLCAVRSPSAQKSKSSLREGTELARELRRKTTGKVLSVLERARDSVTGTLISTGDKLYLLPDGYIGHRIAVQDELPAGCKPGDKVFGELGKYRTPSGMRVTIKESFGSAKELEPNIKALLREEGLDKGFESEALVQAKQATYDEITPYLSKRSDLRGKTIVTVSKDESSRTECAFSVERDKDNNYVLGVHVADVAEYIPYGSALDRSAAKRGKTVVLPDKDITMLPEALAHGPCFLEIGVDKLAVSVILTISQTGEILDFDFCESVINVAANCMFDELDALLLCFDASAILPLREKYSAITPMLQDMFALGGLLQSVRIRSGSADLDKANRHFIFGRHGGKPINIKSEKDSDPDRLIREFITAAGSELAAYLSSNGIPSIYRLQPMPDDEALEKFRALAASLGIVTEGIPDGELFANVAEFSRGLPFEEMLLSELRRILPHTSFSARPRRHAIHGLDKYLRFAYPANRYADLSVQRILKAIISQRDKKSELDKELLWRYMRVGVFVASINEARASRVEDAVSDLYALDFMKKNVGKRYGGVIWSIDAASATVLLNNSCVGLILFEQNANISYGEARESITIGGRKLVVGSVVDATIESADIQQRTLLLKV